jgi:hypothetical protein
MISAEKDRVTTSLDPLYLLSIDSLFNGLLFILIYNINLSKKDKISYYQSFIISTKIRYMYFACLYFFGYTINILLNRPIDVGILACPLFTYLFYNRTYLNRYFDFISKFFYRNTQKMICYLLYIVLRFLSKTILVEECTIKLKEIEEFYSKSGCSKLYDFLQSFAIACIYEYISTSYVSLGFLFQYKSGFKENYDKKQYILGLLNGKQWDKLLHSSTISIFFDIYKNSNNKQISKFIQYQLNRVHYRLLIFFTSWSIIGYTNKTYLIPLLFFFFYIDNWRNNRIFYNVLGLLAIFNMVDYLLILILYSIPISWIYYIFDKIANIRYSRESFYVSLLGVFVIFFIGNHPDNLGFYVILNIILFRRIVSMNIYYILFGYLSHYNFGHMINLCILWNIYILIKLNIKNKIE